ncbi:thiamine pyrophosphate-binding protein [Saccharothrix stipae]
MILSEYVHRQLSAHDVEVAFGIPGYFVMPIWQEFKKSPRIVLSRHESGAAFMADGYSRATGRLGVVLATSGPGMTNCVTGVACAYRDSLPMLVITGQAPTASFGRGAFLESYVLDRAVSPAALFAPITKKSIEVVDSANAAFLIDTAIDLALSGRPGPVHLSIPVDLQSQEVPVPDGVERATTTLPVAPGALRDTAEVLAGAQRPLLLVGWGVPLAGVGAEVARLAEEIGAPVVTTTKAISALAAADPLLACHLGPGQRSDAPAFVRDYRPDVVVALGASMSSYYAGPVLPVFEDATLVRADIDADQLRLRVRPHIALHGDLAVIAPALADAVAQTQRSGPPPHAAARSEHARAVVARFRDRGRRAVEAQPHEHDGAPSMSGTIARLADLLPRDAVVLPDAGNHWLDTLSLHHSPTADGLQLNCGIGAMGWAIGAAVGMAFGRPDRRTVCVTGDGSLLMHGTELSVAAEHGLDLLVIVFNNRSHARVRINQAMAFDGDVVSSDVPDLRLHRWLAEMGLRTFVVERPEDVEDVLREAIATPGTVGVEVRCSPDEAPASLRDWIAGVAP